jgi:hypothetical protein
VRALIIEFSHPYVECGLLLNQVDLSSVFHLVSNVTVHPLMSAVFLRFSRPDSI